MTKHDLDLALAQIEVKRYAIILEQVRRTEACIREILDSLPTSALADACTKVAIAELDLEVATLRRDFLIGTTTNLLPHDEE